MRPQRLTHAPQRSHPPRPAPAALTSRRRRAGGSRGARGIGKQHQLPYAPPETWHEPQENGGDDYRIVTQSPGAGFAHVVTPDQVRQRLSLLPEWMLEPLEVVQLSRMTRKKQSAPCYGMQWGPTLYLYPLEQSRVEHFSSAPKPAIRIETEMYGGRWQQHGHSWRLHWTPAALEDFYLNNVLIHELGHLLDDRNSGFWDRERYAEWFAIEYGYNCPHRQQQQAARGRKKRVRRRHSRT